MAWATDETKLWLSPSAKQHQNSCSRPHLLGFPLSLTINISALFCNAQAGVKRVRSS